MNDCLLWAGPGVVPEMEPPIAIFSLAGGERWGSGGGAVGSSMSDVLAGACKTMRPQPPQVIHLPLQGLSVLALRELRNLYLNIPEHMN